MIEKNLLFSSTSYILGLFEKVFSTNIELKGIENIPKDKSILFVANHFTRAEALLVPSAIYKETNKSVGVIAADVLFTTAFANFFKRVGALRKSDPNRNNIIIGNLLESSKDWMIFPEGLMVKAKDITKHSSHYNVKIDGTNQKVHTGAAFFALYSQILRSNYFSKKIKNTKKFQRKYFIKDLKNINEKETVIVPINISYSKITKGKNYLYRMIKSLFSHMPDSFKEELEIETNLILHSKMTIQILKSISIKDILNDSLDKELNQEKIINKYRHDLTKSFMNQIYENLTISFNHLFILTLFLYPKKEIDINHFKRLLYLIIEEVKRKELFVTEELINNHISFISYEKYEVFEEVLQVALDDQIIETLQDKYLIHKDNLLNSYTHNTIRLKNSLRVILNEILLMQDVKDIVSLYVNKNELDLNEELYDFLIKEEKDEYQRDYSKYRNHEDIKDKEIGEPYILSANSNICVIALHGFASSPSEVKQIAQYLNNKNINVYAPRLKGHGTIPSDLKDVLWKDWYDSLSRAITIATLKYKKVYLLGFSTGGLLTLLSTKKTYKEYKGIISINAALNLQDVRVKTLIPAVSVWNDLVDSFDAKEYQKEYVKNNAQNPEINYNKHYIKSITQLKELMNITKNNLENIKTPILIIQSSNDPVVNPSSAYELYEGIKDKNKILKIIDSKYHVIITKNNQELLVSIRNFIKI
ncbi:MAG: alpha/beta fold hydrolase [Campylobacterales bacterium]|nr:alpha/beta fold hydrolase [Campylobacterales bacterium]